MMHHAAWILVKDADCYREEAAARIAESKVAIDHQWVESDFLAWDDMFLTAFSSPVMAADDVAQLDMGFLPTFIVGLDSHVVYQPGEDQYEQVSRILDENRTAYVALLMVVTDERIPALAS